MKKIYALAGVLLFAAGVHAQAPYKMQQYQHKNFQGEKYTPGAITVKHRRVTENQDRANYYTEDFNSGLNGWVANTPTGPADFVLTSTGHQNSAGNTFVIPDLVTTGDWIMIDSDGDNNSYTNPEEAMITSPRMDLTSAVGDFVALQFDQFFAEWDVNVYQGAESEDHCYIAVSTDSTIWTEIEINEGVGRDSRMNPEMISWDITDEIQANIDSVWVRFRWEGAWNYGWQFDNVKIESIPEKDLEIVDFWRPSMRDIDGSMHMYSKVPQMHADSMVIGAIVRNSGHITQTNVELNLDVDGPITTGVITGGSSAYPGGAIASLDPSPNVDTILFLTNYVPNEVGVYSTELTVTSTEGDDFAANDVVTDNIFELTQTTYATDYPGDPEQECEPWVNSSGQELHYGHIFDFKDDDVITSVQFKTSNHTSNVGESILVTIWAFEPGAGWVSEYYSDAYTLQTGDIDNWVSIPIANGYNALGDTGIYAVTVGLYTEPTNPVFMKQGNNKLGRIQGILWSTDQSAYLGSGYFDWINPMVRIEADASQASIEAEEVEEMFAIFPNPATEAINVSLALENSENTMVNILDISGKVIKQNSLGTVSGEQTLSISMTDVSTGVYFVELVNSNGRSVKKFVKK